MNELEKKIEKLVLRIIDESKDLVDDVVDEIYYDEGGAGIKDMCFQVYSLIEDQVNDEFEDEEDDISDEMESDIFGATKTAIKKNRKKIDSMVRCALHEMEGS